MWLGLMSIWRWTDHEAGVLGWSQAGGALKDRPQWALRGPWAVGSHEEH